MIRRKCADSSALLTASGVQKSCPSHQRSALKRKGKKKPLFLLLLQVLKHFEGFQIFFIKSAVRLARRNLVLNQNRVSGNQVIPRPEASGKPADAVVITARVNVQYITTNTQFCRPLNCRRSSEGTCMLHSGSSSFLKLPSALINGDIEGICRQEKKSAV